MPRKGENIYKRKDGRWEGRYIRSYDSEHKAKYAYVYGKTYSEVKRKLLVCHQCWSYVEWENILLRKSLFICSTSKAC